jgi:hypothetical protein
MPTLEASTGALRSILRVTLGVQFMAAVIDAQQCSASFHKVGVVGLHVA